MNFNKKIKNNFSSISINWKRKISCYNYLFLEFLAVKSNFFNTLLNKWRTPVFLQELDMIKVSPDDKILFIGCGILPTGAIIIAEKTKKTVVAIDNNNTIVKLAKSYIQKKGLSEKIKIEYADGINYPMEKFDFIFIAINVWPIELILKHIHKNMKRDAKIICKGIKNDVIKLFEKDKLNEMFYIENLAKNPKTYSFLLKKIG